MKDSIQDSLDLIVSSDGKLSNAAVVRQLDKKFPSVMRKSNPINVVFKDKAKFDTQNLIIGALLTQIESGKLNDEKQTKKQLEAAPFIKDLKNAKQLKRLRDLNKKRTDDDNNDDDDAGGFLGNHHRFHHCLCRLLFYRCIILPHLQYLKKKTLKLKKI